MTYPFVINVGPHSYRLLVDRESVERAIEDAGVEVLGYTNHQDLEITVDIDHAESIVADTLLHELLHAVFYTSGMMTVLGDEEEQVVTSVSTALLDALRRNPALVARILGRAE